MEEIFRENYKNIFYGRNFHEMLKNLFYRRNFPLKEVGHFSIICILGKKA